MQKVALATIRLLEVISSLLLLILKLKRMPAGKRLSALA
jgi:hypothetical protein